MFLLESRLEPIRIEAMFVLLHIPNINQTQVRWEKKHIFVEIFMGNLCREEQESDISSQYGKTSPNSECLSPGLKNTVVRLDSPSFSSNFLTVSFARKQEKISLRVLQSGQGSGGDWRREELNIK